MYLRGLLQFYSLDLALREKIRFVNRKGCFIKFKDERVVSIRQLCMWLIIISVCSNQLSYKHIQIYFLAPGPSNYI